MRNFTGPSFSLAERKVLSSYKCIKAWELMKQGFSQGAKGGAPPFFPILNSSDVVIGMQVWSYF